MIINPWLINPWLILINPCRARGVPREPRSQEGLLDGRSAGAWRGVVAFLSSLFRPRAYMDRFLSAPATLPKSIHFEHFHKSTKMVSQSDLYGSCPLVMPQKVKKRLQHGPKKRHFWTPKRSQCNMMSIFIETQIIQWFPWYVALFDPQ